MYIALAQKLLEARKHKQERDLLASFIEKELRDKKFEISFESKAVSIDEEKHQVTFVMSTSNIDRHGDIIDQNTWILSHFEKNPAFFLQHRSDEFPIGKWLKIWFEADPENPGQQRMLGTAEFRVEYEDAARAFNHVKNGDMNMVSVGFIPHRIEYDEEKDAFILYDCELLECSLVGIGSNRQALAKEKEKSDDPVQAAHDAAIEARNALDEHIKKSHQDALVIAHLKAYNNLSQAIRRLETKN